MLSLLTNSFFWGRERGHAWHPVVFGLIAGTALAIVLALSLGPPQAQAQVVCVGNATGAVVPANTADGAGATAAGSANNVACGTNANASTAAGAISGANTAFGSGANASGNVVNTISGTFPSQNVATGSGANASGNFVVGGTISANVATGNKTNASGDGSFNTATGPGANTSGTQSFNTANGSDAKCQRQWQQ